MKKIIIIDDKPDPVLVYWICNEIEKITHGRYSGVLLGGVIITESLSEIKKLIKEINKEGDTVKGLLIDFVDETHKIVNAGEILLGKLKSDRVLKDIPVVVYTSKSVSGFSRATLVKKGAKDAFRREITEIQKRQMTQSKQVLDAFGIPYGGTGGPR